MWNGFGEVLEGKCWMWGSVGRGEVLEEGNVLDVLLFNAEGMAS